MEVHVHCSACYSDHIFFYMTSATLHMHYMAHKTVYWPKKKFFYEVFFLHIETKLFFSPELHIFSGSEISWGRGARKHVTTTNKQRTAREIRIPRQKQTDSRGDIITNNVH